MSSSDQQNPLPHRRPRAIRQRRSRGIPPNPNPNPTTAHPPILLHTLTHASQSAIGSATGSSAWTSSAEADKQSGIDAMKAASADRDANRDGYGKAEELAGKVAGCEGMEKEGAQSKEAGQ
ncbi:hypothetical protein Q7P37_001108 [Cladosporium fusiforme]